MRLDVLSRAIPILAAVSIWTASPAFAHGSRHHGGGACRADVEKLCSDVSGGRHAIGTCLREHESELTNECREKLAAWQTKRERFRACRDDAKRLCGEAERGEIRECLRSHEAELSEGCREVVERRGN